MLVRGLLSLLFPIFPIAAISLDNLFNYGLQYGDQTLPTNQEDVASGEIFLTTNVRFFSREYNSLFVNENGLITFMTEIPNFYSAQFPMNYPLVAVYYSDVDTRGVGEVYYRASNTSEDIGKAQQLIQQYFQGRFQPSEVFIATWDQVGRFKEQRDRMNTFQAVLASDGQETYLLMLYPHNLLQWIRSQGKNPNSPDAKAQVGLMSGEGRHYLHRHSGRAQVTKLDQWSNTDQPGLWIYKIGHIEALDSIGQPTRDWDNPDLDPDWNLDPELASSCSEGAIMCHSDAKCVDYNPGFCCQCLPGWYGNGENCLANGLPQRVNGPVNGIINGVEIILEDLHCYVVTQDGRTYTAVSRVPPQIGWDLQGLAPIGTVIAWLFAKPQDGGLNGFSLTGGVFNYTAEVYYPDTGHRATIRFIFKGVDVFDSLSAELYLGGNLPSFPAGSKVGIEDLSEDFTKVGQGEIHATSKRQYKMEGTNRIVSLDVEQTIKWNECTFRPDNADLSTMRLISSRNFIIYDEEEQIVRYAMTSHVKPLGAAENPCVEADCGQNSNCFTEGSTFRCECKFGYMDYTPEDYASICEDKDECADPRTNICSMDARCTNTPGSFTCECNPGFLGNGTSCIKEQTCEELGCHENAQCEMNRYRQKVCVCNMGYQGDGKECTVIPSSISIRGFANPELLKSVVLESAMDLINMEDLGPDVSHFYEVTNNGPYDVGRIQVDMRWPLQDEQGDSVMYLTNKPFISYRNDGREVIMECEGVDDAIVNPLGLNSTLGRKKRESIEYDEKESDHKYANMEYAYGEGMIHDKAFANYDYSHLENQAKSIVHYDDDELGSDSRLKEHAGEEYAGEEYTDPEPSIEPTQFASSEPPFMASGREDFPESDRIVMAPTAMPMETTTSEPRPGQVNIFCRVNLAVNEVAVITIKSRINTQTLNRKYGTMSTFVVESDARLVDNELVDISGSEKASAMTILEVREPHLTPEPGKGIPCGTDVCHKYATCTVSFASIELDNCRCAPGFTGDGITCEPSQEGDTDCRSDGCSENADCELNPRSGLYQCLCRDGFTGNGQSCEKALLSCNLVHNCSPYASCREFQKGDFKCVCEHGFIGDGITCTRNQGGPSIGGEGSQSTAMPSQQLPCNIVNNCSPHAECREFQKGDSRCVCDYGYTGDGYNCMRYQEGGSIGGEIPDPITTLAPTVNPTCLFGDCSCEAGYKYDSGRQECYVDDTYSNSDQCRSKSDCDAKATCEYSQDEGRYLCNCFKGYEGDGKRCQPGPDAGCDILENCDENARCLFDEIGRQHFCRCNNGYSGNGEQCVKDKEIGCNVRNNCHKYARCEFDSYERDFRCICDSARGFTGDGKTCTPQSCLENPTVCSADADCVPMANQEFGCRCKRNFFGDGLECEPSPRQDGNFMLLGQGMFVLKVPFNGKGSKPINVLSSQVATGIDIDCMKGLVYWSDTTNRMIRRANINGSNQEVFLSGDMMFPEGIAIDWVSRNIYWVDPGKDTIEVANMETRERRVLFTEELRQPRSIVVHPLTGNIFWTDWDRSRPKIETSSMDGSERRNLVNVNLGEPNFLVMDYANYQVCWTDGGRERLGVTPRIDCIGTHGGGRRMITELTAGEFPYGLAITENNVYWTDWNKKMVHSADKMTGERQRSINYQLAGIGKPYGLVNVPEECPNLRNSCQDEPCPGTRLCLPNGRGRHTCACSEEEKLRGCLDLLN